MLVDNTMFLRRNYPIVLENIKDKKQDVIIELEDTKNGHKTLKYVKENFSTYLHSKYNPLREAEAIIDKLEERENIDEGSHIIFYGLGLGYHIEIFTKRYPNIKFSLYEPSVEVFNSFLSYRNLKDLGIRNIENISCEYDDGVRQIFLKSIMKNVDKKLIIVDLPIYQKTFEEEQKEFIKNFKEIIKNERSSLHTNYAFQKRWIINSMKNLKEVLRTPNILLEKKGIFKGKPAILVAAGPSLNEEIENIRYVKENGLAYIFSVGSAINTLIHNDIYPDVITSYDPKVANQKVIEIIKKKDIKEIPIIFGSSIGHETIENYPGEKYHMITSQDTVSNYYLKNEDDTEINIVQDAPSIAVVTLQLLSQLGFNSIILVGQNLAYRGKDRHSEAVHYSKEVTEEEMEEGIWVKDVYDGEVLTDEGFNSMRQQMEHYINHLPNIDIINTTKGGARIEGTRFLELSNIIDDKLQENTVRKDWLEGNKTRYDKEYLDLKLRNMDRSYYRVLKINKEYNNILDIIDRLIKNRSFGQAEKMYVRLDKELKKIESNDFYEAFILPMNRAQYKILADSIDRLNEIRDPYKKGKEILESFRRFMDACIIDMEMISLIYEEMKENIKKYIEES